MKKLLLGALMLSTVSTYAQTKKVIVEDYTGLKCGWCPEGTVILEGLHMQYPTVIIPVAVHGGGYEPSTSPLKNTDAEAIITYVKPAGYPAGSVDRKVFSGETSAAVSRSKWGSYFNQQAATPAIVSVAFANKKYDKTTKEYSCDVNVEFTSAPLGKVKLQVYVIEDSIPATGVLAQDNYSANVQGGASPLNPWFHNRTFRKILLGTNWEGVSIEPTKAKPDVNKVYTTKLKFTMDASWDKDQVSLVGYVTNDLLADKAILNAEESHGVSKTFWPEGIEKTTAAVEVSNIYPSPASVNGLVNIQYSIDETSDVSMKVYNSVGQLVAQPYNSHEVTGSHIINWNPSANGITAGVYMIEVSTANGKQVQRVSLF